MRSSLSRKRPWTCAALTSLILLSGTLLIPAHHASAQPSAHPRLFALDASDFPSGSRITRSSVETNSQLGKDEALHFGLPPKTIGRITGYYMVAEEGSAGAEPAIYTSYLVSIFGSRHQAQSAFDYRWDMWFRANFYTSPRTPPVKLGDRGTVALFHSLASGRQPTTELFFRRGSVLVEVFQGTPQGSPSGDETRSLYAIATALNGVAGAHPRGI